MNKFKRHIKLVNKGIKYNVYENYNKEGIKSNYTIVDGKLKIRAVPSYISKCYVGIDDLKFKLYLIKKDIKTTQFRVKNSKSVFQLDACANVLAILIGMKLATEDYMRKIN